MSPEAFGGGGCQPKAVIPAKAGTGEENEALRVRPFRTQPARHSSDLFTKALATVKSWNPALLKAEYLRRGRQLPMHSYTSCNIRG